MHHKNLQAVAVATFQQCHHYVDATRKMQMVRHYWGDTSGDGKTYYARTSGDGRRGRRRSYVYELAGDVAE